MEKSKIVIVAICILISSCISAVYSDDVDQMTRDMQSLNISQEIQVIYGGHKKSFLFDRNPPGGIYLCWESGKDTLWRVHVTSATTSNTSSRIDSITVKTEEGETVFQEAIEHFKQRKSFEGVIEFMEQYGVFTIESAKGVTSIGKMYNNGDYQRFDWNRNSNQIVRSH